MDHGPSLAIAAVGLPVRLSILTLQVDLEAVIYKPFAA